MLLQASMETSGMAAWRSDMKWTDDEDDHDSDTDSKLSGSAIVDSVMKKFRTRGFKEYPPVMSGEISFDPVADQRFVETQQPFSGGNLDPRLRIGVMNPAMTSSPRNSPGTQRRPVPGSTASPKFLECLQSACCIILVLVITCLPLCPCSVSGKDPTEPFERSVSVARSDISQFKDSKEPNLNDVVDYLASTDPNLVIRAASYLQHLS
eukprot:Em0017g512a